MRCWPIIQEFVTKIVTSHHIQVLHHKAIHVHHIIKHHWWGMDHWTRLAARIVIVCVGSGVPAYLAIPPLWRAVPSSVVTVIPREAITHNVNCQIVAAPEPSSIIVLAVGIVTIIMLRKKQNGKVRSTDLD